MPLIALLAGCWVGDDAVERALDRDGDGFRTAEVGGTDCDDGDPSIHPEASELCGDGLDNDCDGAIDDDGVGAVAIYEDADGDGFGRGEPRSACTVLPGHADRPGDCDDADPGRHPEALDLCDGVDDDCDGAIDDASPFYLFFRDADGDGAGDARRTLEACAAPDGWVREGGDCDDRDPSIRPGRPDPCDGIDQDCDGIADEDASFFVLYPDEDDDGWGATDGAVTTCRALPGMVDRPGDCDDDDPGVTRRLWYTDHDGDGWGAPPVVDRCEAPPGTVSLGSDCDDDNPAVHPDRPEICGNGLDDDCQPMTDCAWSGTLAVRTAPMQWTPPPGWILGVLPDLDEDGQGEFWAAGPDRTEIHLGALPPDPTQVGGFTLPAGCLPAAGPPMLGNVLPSLVCVGSPSMRLYPHPLDGEHLAVHGDGPGFGTRWAVSVSPPGLWIGAPNALRFYPYANAIRAEQDATVEIRVADGSIATMPDAVDDQILITAYDRLYRFDTPLPGVYGPEDATVELVTDGAFDIEYVFLGPDVRASLLHLKPEDPTEPDRAVLHLNPILDPSAGVEEAVGFLSGYTVFAGSVANEPFTWVLETGTATGLVLSMYGFQATIFDVDVWFVDPGSPPPTLIATEDYTGDGARDLVFRAADGTLIVYPRQLP